MAGKSAPYCCSELSNKVGLFLLCEVAMGNPQKFYGTNEDADILPAGYHSSQCIGTRIPDPKENLTMFGDVTVPSGKKISNPDKQA